MQVVHSSDIMHSIASKAVGLGHPAEVALKVDRGGGGGSKAVGLGHPAEVALKVGAKLCVNVCVSIFRNAPW